MSSDREVFEFSEEDIALRIADIWQLAEDFIDGFLQDENFPRPHANLIINKRLLLLATESAYQDIARYKNYHQKDPKNDKLDCAAGSAG